MEGVVGITIIIIIIIINTAALAGVVVAEELWNYKMKAT
jgi:hypothetical protein